MMSQTHIGYTYWQQPPVNKMPDVTYIETASGPIIKSDEKLRSVSGLNLPSTNKTIFVEQNEVVSMEAENWTRAISPKDIKWKVIPDVGKTSSGITTFPVTVNYKLSSSSPQVEYEFYTYSRGKATVNLYFSPTLNFHNHKEGLQFAVSIDDEKPQIISLNKEDKNSISGVWNSWVANNIIIKKSEHQIDKPGKHVLKYWMISPAVILQKLVVDLGGLKPSYLGPPETKK
jgi:hypothetical protein